MSADRVRGLDELARDRHPALCGVEVLQSELVTGRLDLKRELVAGTAAAGRFLACLASVSPFLLLQLAAL